MRRFRKSVLGATLLALILFLERVEDRVRTTTRTPVVEAKSRSLH